MLINKSVLLGCEKTCMGGVFLLLLLQVLVVACNKGHI